MRVCTFVYSNLGKVGALPTLVSHSGQLCFIVSELGPDDKDPATGRAFLVRFGDGVEAIAFEYELS